MSFLESGMFLVLYSTAVSNVQQTLVLTLANQIASDVVASKIILPSYYSNINMHFSVC